MIDWRKLADICERYICNRLDQAGLVSEMDQFFIGCRNNWPSNSEAWYPIMAFAQQLTGRARAARTEQLPMGFFDSIQQLHGLVLELINSLHEPNT